jgi:hypothetical protein
VESKCCDEMDEYQDVYEGGFLLLVLFGDRRLLHE